MHGIKKDSCESCTPKLAEIKLLIYGFFVFVKMGRTSEGSEYEKNCMMSRIKDVQKQLVQKL